MKETFYHLDEDKRRRIEAAALEEFGRYGYERGSTDRIIRKSGISKGGLYEYISSKEDLFLHIVELAYGSLYDHIGSSLRMKGAVPSDLLERFRAASASALSFYLKNPSVVRLLASIARIDDPDAKSRAEAIFGKRFLDLFGDADFSGLRFGPDRVLDLLRWMLIKTRNDFIAELERYEDGADLPSEKISSAYIADWEFILSVLSDGIYIQRGKACLD